MGACGKSGRLVATFLVAVLLSVLQSSADDDAARWWPVQTFPKMVVRIASPPGAPATNAALQMMIQSVAGLAAQSVNKGRGDELVWVAEGNPNHEEWFKLMRAAHPELQCTNVSQPWELVDRYVKAGIIKGYILYSLDTSSGAGGNAGRPGMDCSVNVATSLAGLSGGILIAEPLEAEAKAHGLKLLLDVRHKTQAWCFQTYKQGFNRHLLFTQDPQKPNARDLAIAQRAFTVYGMDEPTPAAMAWLEPLSPILGWNCGDEFEITDLSSRYGHIQTDTDWTMNLPVLMAGSETNTPPRQKGLDPRTIDWGDQRSAVAFVDTDGDNVDWSEGNFFLGDSNYWSNAERGKIPFGWSSCFAQLTQLCPEAIDYALTTRSTNDSFLEWGGGYYYPDHFGRSRTNRWDLLARHARRTWQLMKKTNSRIIGFDVARCDSREAQRAYQVIAGQTEGLLAVFVFQYYPYEAGAGKVFWVKDSQGFEVPVITARYAIWEHSNGRERAGTPAKVARDIRQTLEKQRRGVPRYDWVNVHAWSYFKRSPGPDEEAENMPQEKASEEGGSRGYSPAVWCAERLPTDVRVVSPEELVWRIRMQHDAAQTRRFMGRLK